MQGWHYGTAVLFHFTHLVTSGYSISIIRDPARGTSQLYLRVAWTSVFKQFFILATKLPANLAAPDSVVYSSDTRCSSLRTSQFCFLNVFAD